MFFKSEMPCLGKACSSTRVSNGKSVSGSWVNGPSAARLCRKEFVAPRTQRLPGGKCELISNRRRCAVAALNDLASDGVVLSVEADSSRSLNDNRD